MYLGTFMFIRPGEISKWPTWNLTYREKKINWNDTPVSGREKITDYFDLSITKAQIDEVDEQTLATIYYDIISVTYYSNRHTSFNVPSASGGRRDFRETASSTDVLIHTFCSSVNRLRFCYFCRWKTYQWRVRIYDRIVALKFVGAPAVDTDFEINFTHLWASRKTRKSAIRPFN